MSVPVLLSGNEITDATRLSALRGDGLLPESSMGFWESSTNLMINGGFEVNTNNWTLQGAATITRTTAQDKFGSACLQVDTTGAGTGEGAGQTGNKTAVNVSTQYTVSMWVFAPVGATLRLTMKEYLAGAFVRDTGFTNFTGNGAWQRVLFTGTTGTGIDGLDPRIATITSAQAITFYVDGVQIEQKPLATPYMETAGSSASRSLSRIRIPIGTMDETQGWVAARMRMNWASTNIPVGGVAAFVEWYDNSNNRILGYYQAGDFRTLRVGGGVGLGTVSQTKAFSLSDLKTVVWMWDANNLYVSVDGAAFTAAAQTSVPVLASTAFDLGSDTANTDRFADVDFFWAAFGSSILADNDAKIINSFGNSDRNPSEFPGACSMVWHANTNFAIVPSDQGTLPAPFTPAGHGATW